MNYANLKPFDVANGSGIRVSFFVSGCRHHCPDCFNPEGWDFSAGTAFTQDTIRMILSALSPSHIRGLTLLGGEPLEPENQEGLLTLLQAVRAALPEKDVWCYTGFVYEALPLSRAATAYLKPLLDHIDVLVDGPYIKELHDLNLRFRGSSNQRILDLNATRQSGQLTLWTDEFGGQ